MAILKEITENDCVNERHPFVRGDNLTLRDNRKTVQDRCKLKLFTNFISHTGF